MVVKLIGDIVQAISRMTGGFATAAVTLMLIVSSFSASANESGQPTRTINGEIYVPGIWIDPDGCEHWVMDDGWEGFMTPNVTRDGKPVCHNGNKCASLNTDNLFRSNGYQVGAANHARLLKFFRTVEAESFIITGYTDSRGAEAYNQRLSQRRAQAVARIASEAGATLLDVRGYGENTPRASNKTAAGRAENRRVDVICVN